MKKYDITPIGKRIIARPDSEPDIRKEGSIYLPPVSDPPLSIEATVLVVSKQSSDSGIEVGDKILVSRFAGFDPGIGDEGDKIYNISEVIAVIS